MTAMLPADNHVHSEFSWDTGVDASMAKTITAGAAGHEQYGETRTVLRRDRVRSSRGRGPVIVAWDDKPIDHRSLPWVVSQTPVGKTVKVTLWRNKAPFDLAIVTEKMPQ